MNPKYFETTNLVSKLREEEINTGYQLVVSLFDAVLKFGAKLEVLHDAVDRKWLVDFPSGYYALTDNGRRIAEEFQD